MAGSQTRSTKLDEKQRRLQLVVEEARLVVWQFEDARYKAPELHPERLVALAIASLSGALAQLDDLRTQK